MEKVQLDARSDHSSHDHDLTASQPEKEFKYNKFLLRYLSEEIISCIEYLIDVRVSTLVAEEVADQMAECSSVIESQFQELRQEVGMMMQRMKAELADFGLNMGSTMEAMRNHCIACT